MNKVPISGEEGRGKGPFFPWGSEKIASQRLFLRPSLAAAPAAITVLLVKAPSVPHSLLLPPGDEVCYKRKGERGGGEGAKRSQFYFARGSLGENNKLANYANVPLSLPLLFFLLRIRREKEKSERCKQKRETKCATFSSSRLTHVFLFVCVIPEHCPDPSCSGHGSCLEDARCHCDLGWMGSRCERRNEALLTCLPDCSGHGRFDQEEGRCLCQRQWTGRECNISEYRYRVD